jgi:hypothetical protein
MARHPQSDPSAVVPSDILSERGSSLGGVLSHARLLLQLQNLLAGSVDPSLATRFQVANLRQGRLILLAPSAAWSTRLRMETPGLLGTLHRAGHAAIREIDVRVAPLVETPAPVRVGKPLSAAARQALDSMARLKARSGD